jgi:predicted nucleic acid-binding protein
VTVVDSSVVVDFLLGVGAASQLQPLLDETADADLATAPDVLVFEVLSALRRAVHRGMIDDERAVRAVVRLTRLSLALAPALPLCETAWGLRHNIAPADALFVSLALAQGMPLVTKDRRLARAARLHTDVDVIELD